jgi:hypothetical protein
LRRFEELESVAERIVSVGAPEAREVAVPLHILASTGQVLDERIKAINDDPRMRLTSGPEVVLDAEMKLYAPGAKPHAAAGGEHHRLVDLCHAQDIDEERASCGLLTARRRQLHVMHAVEHKTSSGGDESGQQSAAARGLRGDGQLDAIRLAATAGRGGLGPRRPVQHRPCGGDGELVVPHRPHAVHDQ